MDYIKYWLEQYYSNSRVGIITYPEEVYDNNFVLSDSKSCLEAKKLSLSKCVNCCKDVIHIDVDAFFAVHVLNFEQFVNQFNGTSIEFKGKRCDYLLYDINENMQFPQIVFCELTCMDAQHIEKETQIYDGGKRAYAYEQIKNSIEKLLEVPNLKRTILDYPSKIGLFGWRESKNEANNDKAAESMENFIETPSEMSPILYNTVFVLGHGFTFVQIKYPTTHFVWGKRY